MPAITGAHRGEIALVESANDNDFDVAFRMFQPHELAAAMGLDGYDFAGTKTEITKQIGNAVSRRQAKAIVKALMQPTLLKVAA